MADIEPFLYELRRESEDSASIWHLLRLFQENDFDPVLTTRILRAIHDSNIRLETVGIVRMPDRKPITPLSDADFDKIVDLIRTDSTVVSVPAVGVPHIASSEGKSVDERRYIEEVSAAYIAARPHLAKAMVFTMDQNYFRSMAKLPLFGLGVFFWDVRDFMEGSVLHVKSIDPIFIHRVTRKIYSILQSNSNKGSMA